MEPEPESMMVSREFVEREAGAVEMLPVSEDMWVWFVV